MEALKNVLPEPELWQLAGGKWQVASGNPNLDLLIVSWGSNKSVILDVLATSHKPQATGYLHYTYMWPLKTDRLLELSKKAKKIILIEQNFTGQLGEVIRMSCGLTITEKILKYDGRPFFFDELLSKLSQSLPVRQAGVIRNP